MEVQNTYISTAHAFLIKAKKNDRGMSKEIKWAIRNNLYSMERLINYITEDNTNGLLQGEDENDDEIIKQLVEIVYGYSIHKIKSLYLSLVGDEFELANKFNNILDMIWGFLRFIYNSYNREHKLSKNYKLIGYNFNIIKNKLIDYVNIEYNPTNEELEKIINDYIEDFDNYDIYSSLENYIKETKIETLYMNNNVDVDLYKNLLYEYKTIIYEMVEDYNHN
jgi:hypothetical protein